MSCVRSSSAYARYFLAHACAHAHTWRVRRTKMARRPKRVVPSTVARVVLLPAHQGGAVRNNQVLTGCPFSDARGAGLWLAPRIGCGPAHLEGARLVWDPSQPVSVQLRELTEQTAKWRNRRGLHIVRTPALQPEVRRDDEAEPTERSELIPLANTNREEVCSHQALQKLPRGV